MLHKSITSLSFYSSASPCPLPVRSLTYFIKSSKISGCHLVLKHSWDASVSSCVPKLQTGGNWQVEEAVQVCETDLKHKSIIGHHQHSCHGRDILKLLKLYLTNHQETAGHLFPAITKKLRIHMTFPRQWS